MTGEFKISRPRRYREKVSSVPRRATMFAALILLFGACSNHRANAPAPAPPVLQQGVSNDAQVARYSGRRILQIPTIRFRRSGTLSSFMQENRSFDSYFGTFPGADGIPISGGIPAPCLSNPRTGKCERPYHANHLKLDELIRMTDCFLSRSRVSLETPESCDEGSLPGDCRFECRCGLCCL